MNEAYIRLGKALNLVLGLLLESRTRRSLKSCTPKQDFESLQNI